MFELLRQSNIISPFEKEPSFDRLFPNQDYHSGKGFGNLIALPLQGNSIKKETHILLILTILNHTIISGYILPPIKCEHFLSLNS